MKKAIIIGASSGIGRELAKILSRNEYVVGVDLIVNIDFRGVE